MILLIQLPLFKRKRIDPCRFLRQLILEESHFFLQAMIASKHRTYMDKAKEDTTGVARAPAMNSFEGVYDVCFKLGGESVTIGGIG